MIIYESFEEMPLITDPYIFNWECKNKGCWTGPCFIQYEKRPWICPGYRKHFKNLISNWQIIYKE